MSSSQRGKAADAPSLFPFLAVLLCTVGAMVLILVMVVNQSQASVKLAVNTRAQRVEELQAQVELVRNGFKEDREQIQLEIEKKRMSLQGLEKQNSVLMSELEELSKTAELIAKKVDDETALDSTEEQLSDLQKQLREAAEKLKNQLDKPSKEKPVFAIIPYEGANGTHRRPIYLECRADGILIQPEDILIGVKDLKPPYGPGNPLDATLRTIRNHYAPKDGALNTSAYPLLVVRSSGIRTYALARMAMAGWDDQFGYELIEDTMELTFPEGEKSLAREIEGTLVASRNRQAALVMAMPGKYRQAMAELTGDNFGFEDESTTGSDGRTTEGMPSDEPSGDGSATMGFASGGTATSGLAAEQAGLPGRGGFAFAPDGGPSGQRPSANGQPLGSSAGSSSGMQGFATGGSSLNGTGGGPVGSFMSSQPADGQAANGWNATGLPMSDRSGVGSFAEGAFSGNKFTQVGATAGGAGAVAAQGGASGGSGNGTTGEAGGQMAADGRVSGSSASGRNRPGTFQDAMNAARAKQQGSQGSLGDQTTANGSSAGAEAGIGGSQMSSPQAAGFGSVSGNASEPSGESNAMPVPSAEWNRSKKNENSDAVAKRKGRNWAWSAGPSRETAIVRSIRIECYEDRWLVMPDQAKKDKPQTVMLDQSMQTSAEELAKVIAARVDRWGFALAGGYWKPVLQVEVAAGGQQRFDQLKRLLDGSGLEVQRVEPTKK